MKHLIDEREPITTEDIAQAQADARALLGTQPGETARTQAGPDEVMQRLLAIVDYAYGPIDVETTP